jgi:hypothetical protein
MVSNNSVEVTYVGVDSLRKIEDIKGRHRAVLDDKFAKALD